MEYQDFIPLDLDNSKYGKAVEGLRVKIKASGSYTDTTYKVVDFNSDGYLLVQNNNDSKDSAIGRLWETDYTSSSNSNFFAINFDMKKLKALNLDGRDIEISYNAELMGEATTNGATNTAKLRYSNDPFESSTYSNDTTNDKTNVYTYDVKVDKLFSDGATTAFYDKVKFKLYLQDSSVSTRTAINFVKDSVGNCTRADSNDNTVTDELAVSTTNGTLLLHGLGEGT